MKRILLMLHLARALRVPIRPRAVSRLSSWGGDFDEVSTGDGVRKPKRLTRGPTSRSRTTASRGQGEAVPAAAAVVVGVAVAAAASRRTCGASANKDIGTRSWRTMLTSSSMVSRRCWRP